MPIRNAFARLVFFVIIALLLSALRDRLTAEDALSAADRLMCAAKLGGKNRHVVETYAEPGPAAG